MGESGKDGATARGYCGYPVVDLGSLAGCAQPGDLVLFGLDSEISRRFGTSNPGSAGWVRRMTGSMSGPAALGARGGFDVGLLHDTLPEQALQDVSVIAAHAAGIGLRPVLFACDHTASLAAALGSASPGLGEAPLYIHVDAHFDLGWHMARPQLDNGNFVDLLLKSGRIAAVINRGGGSPMTGETAYQHRPGFVWLPASRPESALAELDAALAAHPGRPLYVSIDPDVLDPFAGPGVCCPVPHGLDLPTLLALCRRLGATGRVIGADLSELCPSPDASEPVRHLARCLLALFPL